MELKSILVLAATILSVTSCGGSKNTNDPLEPTSPPNLSSYDGNDYFARVTGKPDSVALSALPPNRDNEVIWNSIALIYHTESGTWAVAMDTPNYYPNVGHRVEMGPFSGTWTTTPDHGYQYRVTQVEWNTGHTNNVNPINSGVPYDIFQPAAPTDWTDMPANSDITLCSVSNNSVYAEELGGGSITCSIEVMDTTTQQISSSRIRLFISR